MLSSQTEVKLTEQWHSHEQLKGIYEQSSNNLLSYDDLLIKINQLACFLKESYPNTKRVALFMTQSVDYMISFFALQAAGMAPMPISPDGDNSSSRLESFLEGGKIQLIISMSFYQEYLFFSTQTVVSLPKIFLDKEKASIEKYENLALSYMPSPNDLAYIINTSGSTGKPKQVLIPYRGISDCINGHIDNLNLTSKDRIAAYADVMFDAHIVEMKIAIEIKASLFIVPSEYRRDIVKLAKFYKTHHITVGVFVASMLRQCRPEDFPELRVVICTGEKIDQELINKWSQGGRLLVDGYGPAENTIATWLKIIRSENTKKIEMKIIPGTECFILKESGLPANLGEEGELCLAGKGLALGYSDDTLTKERFVEIPHPDDNLRKIIIYKTRDKAKLNPDGSIDIVGRLDRQIKVYGKLICPEEIETTIKEHDKEIKQVYVHAVVNPNGHPDIVAYIELYDPNQSLGLSNLYENIRQKLGQTFVPTRWVRVEKFPQSINQKTTFKGLSELTELNVQHIQGDSQQLPQTELEKEIADLFLQTLKIAEKNFVLYRDDDFFQLGGKSLQATTVIQILRSKYGLRLSYDQFIYNASVEQLARAIIRVRNKTEKKEIISLYTEQQTTGNAPVFLIHSLLGDAERDYEKLKSVWQLPRSLYVISARGLKNSEDMDNDLLSIAYDYYLAIKNICPRGPKIIAGWSLGGILALLIKYFFKYDNDESATVVMIDSESPTIFQTMSSLEYAKYLHDLFEKKLLGQFSQKTLPISIAELSVLSKEQQIYKLFNSVANIMVGPGAEENKRLLTVVRNLLLGVLKFRLNIVIQNVHLIAASDTQKNRSYNLGWPSLVKFKQIQELSGDHDSIILVPINATLIANGLEKICTEFQNNFIANILAADLHSKSVSDINEEELNYYIPAKGCRNNNYENRFDLIKFITEDYLNGRQNILLLLGNAGSGKTTFVQFLAKYIQKNVREVIVLYISLALVENPTQGLIETHFRRQGLSDVQIAHLKKHQKFIMIIDGYDETDKGKYQNLYATNHLDQWNAKVIIACRSSYLYNAQNYKLIFSPTKNSRPDYAGLSEVSIVPFDDSQIEAYIKTFLNNPPEEVDIDTDWKNFEKYLEQIDILPGLRDLIRTPFLLRILMEVLPKIVDKYKNIEFDQRIPLTQSKILDAFIENFWERQAVKLMMHGQLPEDGHDVTVDFEKFSIDLAKEMNDRSETRIIYKRGVAPWENYFGNSDKNNVRSREGAPLKRITGDPRNGHVVSFIHDLFIPYFVNRGLFNEFKETEQLKPTHTESLAESFAKPPKTSPAIYLGQQIVKNTKEENTDDEDFQKAIALSYEKL